MHLWLADGLTAVAAQPYLLPMLIRQFLLLLLELTELHLDMRLPRSRTYLAEAANRTVPKLLDLQLLKLLLK